jgi:cell division septum initiation protein DivIVA
MLTKKQKTRKNEPTDVIAQLEQRNHELETELAGADEHTRELQDRATAAEGTLITFHATLEQMGTLLSLAEERARQMIDEAQAEATRIRSEADERVREAGAEVAELLERKQTVLDALVALRASLPTGAREEAPVTAPLFSAVEPPHAAERVSVADLIALETSSGISA